MAPTKGFLPQRMMSLDWLGINWTKVCWMAPYSNFYPLTMTAGQQGRMWSSFLWWGNKEHRMTRIVARSYVFAIPSIAMGILIFLQADWYQAMFMALWMVNQPMPDWAEHKYAEQYKTYAREKPGVTLKHKWGGQVSIPGSEINIPE